MVKILVFAGTTEGRQLVELLRDEKSLEVHACVATEYGQLLLTAENVHAGRMAQDEMESFIKAQGFDLVVDATHPYAAEVSKNIKNACSKTERKYLRLLRKESYHRELAGESCIFVEDTEGAVDFLNSVEGRVLLTTGSKELAKYTRVEDFQRRLFPRVLPTKEVVEACNQLGFCGKQLICMQGPFDYEMNRAMLTWLDCKYMVTKDSGKEGGADEKFKAARDAGVKIVIIGRPAEEGGLSLRGILEEIGIMAVCTGNSPQELLDWFPLFTNIRDKKILIIGGGRIALRRTKTLLNFSCKIEIIAREMCGELVNLQEQHGEERLKLREQTFQGEDLEGADMVLAVADDGELNRKIATLCRTRGIPVNVADRKENCDFFFPGVVVQDQITVGITAQGKDHSLAKEATSMIRRELKCLKEK